MRPPETRRDLQIRLLYHSCIGTRSGDAVKMSNVHGVHQAKLIGGRAATTGLSLA